MKPSNLKRLHLGCGNWTPKGWINADIRRLAGIDLVCDARRGLPMTDASIDYAVSVHALQEMAFAELCPVLREIVEAVKAVRE